MRALQVISCGLLMILLLADCGSNRGFRTGGPCTYDEFATSGEVIRFEQEGDGYIVEVWLNGPPIEGDQQVDLGELFKRDIDREFIDETGIGPDSRIEFAVKQIVKGTCVPLYVGIRSVISPGGE